MNKCPQCRDRLQFMNQDADSKWVCGNCGREFAKGNYKKEILKTVIVSQKVKTNSLKKNKSETINRKKILWWEYIAAFVGIPIELQEKTQKNVPAFVCSITALLLMLVHAFAFRKPELLNEWGLVPANPWQKRGLTIVTEFFFHVDNWHLLGNIYFLLVFGESVEHLIGHARFLILILLSTCFGNLIHLIVGHGSVLPLVGASGGVAGVMLYYAFQFPKKQLGVIFLFQWVRVPAHLYVAFWLIYQVMGAVDQIQQVSPVSYMAHLGGGVVGYVLWRMWKTISSQTLAY